MSKKPTRGRTPQSSNTPKRQVPSFKFEDLDEVYARLSQICAGLPQQLSGLISDRDAVAALPNAKAVAERAEIILRDARFYANQLMLIRKKHAGRTGEAVSPDDTMDQIQIAEEYLRWEDSYTSVVVPNMEYVLGAFQSSSAKTVAA